MIADIKGGLEIILAPGSVVEIRLPHSRQGTMCGYFDNFELLAKNAAALSGKAAGVYVTLNPVRPELLARAQNRVIAYAKHTTTDADIIFRRWLLIDFDSVRPAGISSTETEHLAALKRSAECCIWLANQGWPEPVACDSGNGAHLLYRIDLPNDAQCRELVKRCLEALALEFSDAVVSVDTTIYNAARICKVYGTLAAKGESTTNRPHRFARILEFPSQLAVVDRELLEGLAARLPEQAENERNEKSAFDLSRWIESQNLEVTAEGEWRGGTQMDSPHLSLGRPAHRPLGVYRPVAERGNLCGVPAQELQRKRLAERRDKPV